MNAPVRSRHPLGHAAIVAATLALGAGPLATARAQERVPARALPADPVLNALRDEVRRSLELRLPGAPPPRLVLARAVDEARVAVGASLGALLEQEERRTRTLTVEVKVGDVQLDSANVLVEGESPVRSAQVAYEDGSPALRRTLWLLADGSYKAAAAVLEARRSKVAARERPPGWSSDPAPSGPPAEMPAAPDPVPLARLVRDLSGVFRGAAEIEDARARVIAWSRRRIVVGSDGTEAMDAGRVFLVSLAVLSRTSDGEPVLNHRSFATREPPELAALQAEARRMIPEVLALRVAPKLGDWTGPVLFSGRAAPQLLEATLAPHLSGTPAPESLSGADPDDNPLARRLGRRVLPRGVRLRDDPTSRAAHGFALIGGYGWDDEGTRAQPVTLVDDGRLQQLLLGRIPSAAERSSNGHGRASTGASARGRIANLLFEAQDGASTPELRARALARAREDGAGEALEIELLDDPAITLELLPGDDRQLPEVPRPLIARLLRRDGAGPLVRVGVIDGLQVRDLARTIGVGASHAVHSFLAPGGLVAVRRTQHGELPTSIVAPALLLGDVELRGELHANGRTPLSRPPQRTP